MSKGRPSVLIVVLGLGNPGSEYTDTRHNIGFMVVDKLAALYSVKFGRPYGGLISGKGTVKGKEVLIAKPVTFMNKSGVAAKRAVAVAGIDLQACGDIESPNEEVEEAVDIDISGRLIVVTDDCDLPFGDIRLRRGGGSGGQKGIKSIIEWLGTDRFSRLRMGIGRPANVTEYGLADYFLIPFNNNEKESLEEELKRGVLALESFIEDGVDTAMNRYN